MGERNAAHVAEPLVSRERLFGERDRLRRLTSEVERPAQVIERGRDRAFVPHLTEEPLRFLEPRRRLGWGTLHGRHHPVRHEEARTHLRIPAVHCYLEGDPGPVAAALGLRPTTEGEGGLHLLTPYDPGVFHAALEKAGLKVVCLPQLYVDLLHYERRGAEQAEHLRREAMGY